MSIIVNPKYNEIRGFLLKIPDIFETEGEILYDSRNTIKVLETPDGKRLNVKKYCVPKGINKYVYSTGLRDPKGLRAFVYPRALLESGIDTPEPIAYIEQRCRGMIGNTFFVSEQCDYEHLMYEVGDAEKGTYEELAKALAEFTAKMHDCRMMHLDYSPGNILYTKREGEYRFSVVDINRMYFGHVDIKRGCKSLRRLWGPKDFFITLVREYALCRNFNPDEAVKLALKYRKGFWKKFGRKHKIKFKLEL